MSDKPTVTLGDPKVSRNTRILHGTIDDGFHFAAARGEARVADFAFGSAELDDFRRSQLEAQYNQFQHYIHDPRCKLILRGYASSPGSEEHNRWWFRLGIGP